MKKKNYLTGLIILTCILSKIINAQYSLRMTPGSHIMVHPEKSITFGNSTSSPNNGAWSIESWWGGLNFWKA
jgi:hypothetical protein